MPVVREEPKIFWNILRHFQFKDRLVYRVFPAKEYF